MILCIEQPLFTIGDRFSILDTDGRTKYLAEGEIFTFGKKLHLYHASPDGEAGEECAFIAQELFCFRPHFTVELAEPAGTFTVIKEFEFFTQYYSVPERGWEITGDFFDHEYSVLENGHPIATVSKEWLTFGDCYKVECARDADMTAVLCSALVIDCIEAAKK